MIGGIFSRLFGPHPIVEAARTATTQPIQFAFHTYDPDSDEYQVGVHTASGDRIAIYGYDAYGDADAAAGALARAYRVGIRS